jgi:hypothetical protein
MLTIICVDTYAPCGDTLVGKKVLLPLATRPRFNWSIIYAGNALLTCVRKVLFRPTD